MVSEQPMEVGSWETILRSLDAVGRRAEFQQRLGFSKRMFGCPTQPRPKDNVVKNFKAVWAPPKSGAVRLLWESPWISPACDDVGNSKGQFGERWRERIEMASCEISWFFPPRFALVLKLRWYSHYILSHNNSNTPWSSLSWKGQTLSNAIRQCPLNEWLSNGDWP